MALARGFIVACLGIGLGWGAIALYQNMDQDREGRRLVTGKAISPLGDAVEVGSFPNNMVRTVDGKFAVVTNVGFRQQLSVIDLATGKIVSKIDFNQRPQGQPRPGLYYGLAVTRGVGGSTRLFASHGARDRVSEYRIDSAGQITPGRVDYGYEPVGKSNFAKNYAGVAVDANRDRLYVVNNQTHAENEFRGSLSVYELGSQKLVREVPVGGFPYAIAAPTAGPKAGNRVYVTNERDGSVSAVDPNTGKVIEIKTGSHPVSLKLNREQTQMIVCNAHGDTLSVVDLATERVLRTILVRPAEMRGLVGATPMGIDLSPSEETAFVALADMNCVAVIDMKAGKLAGYLPAGWGPQAVTLSEDGNTLLVANAKGNKLRNPNGKDEGNGRYIANIIEGTVSRIDLKAVMPGLAAQTEKVIANNFIQAGLEGKAHPTFKNPGIEHVIYIVKENRTYDQVLSDIPKGDRDTTHLMYGREITPNQHALAERFVLMDNMFVCAEVSADGWNWSTAGMASEYVSRNSMYNYSGRGRAYDFEGTNNGVPVDRRGIKDVATPPSGYIWDNAFKHGVSVRNYGFFTSNGADAVSKTNDNEPTKASLAKVTDTNFRRYDLAYADSDAWVAHGISAPVQVKKFGKFDATSRFNQWKREFDEFSRTGKFPQLMLVRFGNDHTWGTAANRFSPRAMVADNDYAVGCLVEAISQSPIWKKCAILILEDDAQNGQDHVDAHRSTGYVISPYVKNGLLYSRFANTDSFLRTIELLLGMPPMNQYDAVAPPLFVFGEKPDNDAPFKAILPAKEIVCEINKPTAYRSADSLALIPQLEADNIPEDEVNDILWHDSRRWASKSK